MKLLKEFSINLLIGLNVFILFFLFFEKRIEIPPLLKVVGRTHPLLLHFPIVLLILAFVMEFFKKQFQIEEKSFKKLTAFVLFAGSLTSASTVIFGLFLSQEEGYAGDTLQWHKWTGIAASFLSCGLVWAYSENIRAIILKTVMAITFVFLMVAGHYGAGLTHGDGFLLEPLASGEKEENRPDLKNALVYDDLVKPVLKDKCFSCHNPDKAKGQLVMTEINALKKGGKTGKLFIEGKSGESLMIKRLLLDIEHKHRMPPKGKPQLNEDEVAFISAWIDNGASFTTKLSAIPATSKIHGIASTLYGGLAQETFTFNPADEAVVTKLNNTYRLVSRVAYGSPGLDVSLFGRDAFNRKSLEELVSIAEQIVHLNLSGMNITDADMALITGFPNLRQLNLNYTPITDKGLKDISKLKDLESIMLSGTGVTTAGIAKLSFLKKLRNVYTWNTSVQPRSSDSLMKKYPQLHIETGFENDGKDTLTLNNPEISPTNAFFRKPFLLKITHPIGGTNLLYTLNGLSPDSTEPLKFQKPFLINKNISVKVMAAKKGWASSKVIERSYQRSSIKPDTISLKTIPHPLHKGLGASTLFDLAEGSTDILYASDGNWLGYRNQDFIAELGFRKPTELSEVILSTLTSVALESFPPTEVEAWVSADGKEYVLAGKLNPAIPGEKSRIEHNMLNIPIKKQRVTYIRIVCKSLRKMPPWHKKAGAPSWFFIDEILLN